MQVYIHAREDVPNINHPLEENAVLNWGTIFTMRFQVNKNLLHIIGKKKSEKHTFIFIL